MLLINCCCKLPRICPKHPNNAIPKINNIAHKTATVRIFAFFCTFWHPFGLPKSYFKFLWPFSHVLYCNTLHLWVLPLKSIVFILFFVFCYCSLVPRSSNGFCRCFAFQIGKICCHHCIIRHFQFRKCLPVNSNRFFAVDPRTIFYSGIQNFC